VYLLFYKISFYRKYTLNFAGTVYENKKEQFFVDLDSFKNAKV